MRRAGVALLLVLSACSNAPSHRAEPSTSATPTPQPAIHIGGNHFVDAQGKTMRLVGTSVQGSEYACVSPVYNSYLKDGLFDTPADDAMIGAMARWKINVVRVPLNEDCWLGINPLKRGGEPDYKISIIRNDPNAGPAEAAHYKAGITDLVSRLHAHGLMAILELHWSAAGNALAFAQWPLPDMDHSITFWQQVATAFKDDSKVMFEVFNEPFMGDPNKLPWSCLRDGCTLPNGCTDCTDGVIPNGSIAPGCDACPTQKHPLGSYKTAGFQAIVDAIRAAGASQPILIPGRNYTNDLGQWVQFKPNDSLNQLAASFHAYQGLPCDKAKCWDADIARIAAQYPVVATEFGPDTENKKEPCDESYDKTFLNWADAHGVSYLVWSWYVDTDTKRPACSLGTIIDYKGTPRPGHGKATYDHFTVTAVESFGWLRAREGLEPKREPRQGGEP